MLTILLVEDNDDTRFVYATYLRHVGYEVLVAGDAEAGIALARAHRPAAVLMDIGLPGMDGYAATRLLKSDPDTRHIPVVALTAYALAEDRTRAREAGCDLHLSKPVEPRTLREHLGRLLERHTGAPGTPGTPGTPDRSRV